MMTRNRLATLGLASVLAFSAVASPVLAQEQTEDTRTPAEQLDDAWEEARQKVLDGVKKHADAAVAHRIRSINEMRGWLNENEHVTDAHAASLRADLNTTESGLTALNAEIQASTTVEEALQLTEKIASDYRVYVVMVPKAAGVVIGDTVEAIAGELDKSVDGVQEVVDALATLGFDVDKIQDALDDSRAHADKAAALGSGVSSSVIGLDAADWPQPAESVIRQGKADLDASGREIRDSVHDLKLAIRLIQETVANG